MKSLLYIILLTLAICITSCRSIRYVPVETVRTEYKTRDSIRFDSIYEHDSIFLFLKGDTVYKEKYRYKYRYLTINKTDTVMMTDSVQVPYPVEKQLSRWQQMKIELGGWAFGMVVISFIVLIIRFVKGGNMIR
jgi:hypothetical protein|uniref:Uncharacterized protein n=1 Tax=Siphoviridae sp. cttma3 TaxID=2825708 RepID=A0A8S5V8R2_9CAUD|nr:MAG TPA: hypothetical protein [Siphoviridae sp. cttma3]DAI04099.1 MAG TPA: hypothetical protein [Caudoviricetes sp.]